MCNDNTYGKLFAQAQLAFEIINQSMDSKFCGFGGIHENHENYPRKFLALRYIVVDV